MKKIVLIFTLIVTISSKPSPNVENEVFTEEDFGNGMTYFTENFMNEIWDKSDNFVFSPFSLHSALAIVASGAKKDSPTQFEILGLYGSAFKNIKGLEAKYQKIIQNYKTDEIKKHLTFGNGFWTKKSAFKSVKSDFINTVKNVYDGQIDNLEENMPEKEINDFVKEKTRGKIEKILDEVDPDSLFVIVNALHFKASWSEEFKTIGNREFTNHKEEKIMTPMIRGTSNFGSFIESHPFKLRGDRKADLTLVKIPMEDNQRFEMVIVMPKEAKHLDRIHKIIKRKTSLSVENKKTQLLNEVFEKLDNAPKFQEFEITMPSFKIDTDLDVKETLEKLGVVEAMTNAAEFTNITDEPVQITKAKHKATIEVDKNGIEGAAATAIEFGLKSDSFILDSIFINKPFLYFVRDKEENVVIFAGKYTNPQ